VKFLLDSCVSLFAVAALRSAGYEALWIPETGKDPGDKSILQKAFNEKYVLVTLDKDFGELVYISRFPHPAIIRMIDIPAKRQGSVLLDVIKHYKIDIEKRAILTVDRYRTRIRT
jgi:predicted nuclease of predicted toxin-antitoxin system